MESSSQKGELSHILLYSITERIVNYSPPQKNPQKEKKKSSLIGPNRKKCILHLLQEIAPTTQSMINCHLSEL